MPDTLARMRQLIGTSAQWTANNLILGDGEIGVEVVSSTVRRFKVGDGVRTFTALPYSSVTQADLDAEIANRASGDETLAANLAAEANARIAADNAEATTRGNADTTLQTNITNEANARIAADNAEMNARTAADTAEANARIAADNTEATTRANADTALQTNITNEANARIAADNAETNARTAGDNALDTRVDALEAGAGTVGGQITAIQAALTAETNARIAADNAINATLTNEISARQSADTALDARLDTLEGQNLDSRLDALESEILTVPPVWLARATIGGVEKIARLHVRFPSGQYWCDGVQSFDYLIAYQSAESKLYCDDAGVFRYAATGAPVITSNGLMFWRTASTIVKYNRDPRVNWRVNVTGMSGGEFFTDGEPVTTSAGGAGIYIGGESPIVLLGNWTGAAPANGQTLTGANAIASISTSITPAWVHNNVSVVRDQPNLEGVPNMACRITATAANASILQPLTATSSTRRTVLFARRLVGAGEVALTTDGGATWNPKSVTSAQFGRFAGDIQTLANPSLGLRLATLGDQIVVDYLQSTDRGPSQAECYTPGQAGGLGTAYLPPQTAATQVTIVQPLAWIKRTLGSFINDRTRITVVTKLVPTTSNPGGTELQFDQDGTDLDVAVQNRSTEGTASNNNFGVTYRSKSNPPGFGSDPQGPKGTANVPHVIAWTMNANDTGGGMAMCMIVGDGSEAEVNVNHPPEHFPRGLQFIRLGMQWAAQTLPSGIPGYNPTTGFLTEFAVFDGVPTVEELEALAPGSQFQPPPALMMAGLEAQAGPVPMVLTDDDGADVEDQADATSIRFICPRSRRGTRRCTHRLGQWNGDGQAPTLAQPIACPGCGWHGRITAGALVEELEAGAADPPPA